MTYRRAGLREEQDFKPVAFEMLGGWDEEGVILLKRITSILARNQRKDEGETEVPGSPGVSISSEGMPCGSRPGCLRWWGRRGTCWSELQQFNWLYISFENKAL